MATRRLTEKDILAQIPAAIRRRRRSLREKPHAVAASVDTRARVLHVRLLNGCAFAMPVDVVPSLRSLSDEALRHVEVPPGGTGLRWDAEDVDLSVVGLARVALGGTNLLRAAGAAGGSSRSAAKARAARENGKRGGRPRRKVRSR